MSGWRIGVAVDYGWVCRIFLQNVKKNPGAQKDPHQIIFLFLLEKDPTPNHNPCMREDSQSLPDLLRSQHLFNRYLGYHFGIIVAV
jgi:hypothetical protein